MPIGIVYDIVLPTNPLIGINPICNIDNVVLIDNFSYSSQSYPAFFGQDNRNLFQPNYVSISVYRIKTRDFNLDYSLSCGQVFRWEKNDWWTGIVDGTIVRIKQDSDDLVVDSSIDEDIIFDYFRLGDDLPQIYASINRDEKIASLIHKYRGLHIIRQHPWECLVSYMCSSNNTIRNITNSIKCMSECFGKKIDKGFYSFPTPEELSDLEVCDMSQCKLGFRAPRVLKLANMISNNEFDLYGIKHLSYRKGREKLVEIEGVGNKIADCVLLFAFGKLESFPVDTHIEQIMERYYGSKFKAPKSKKKEEIADFARDYFGKYCGYAQEYLYIEDVDKITKSLI